MHDWKLVLDRLSAARRVLIASHVNPDGDSIGSQVALAAWLAARGAGVRILSADPVPPRCAHLDRDGRIELYDPARHSGLADGIDLVVVLDVGRLDRLGGVADLVTASPAPRVCIDHHPGAIDFETAAAFIDPTAAATGELLVEMFEAAGTTITPGLATPLWFAVMTDTGSFRHGNTTPRTLRIAAALLEQGVDTAEQYDRAYGRSPEPRLRLMGEALTRFDRVAGGAGIVASLPYSLLRQLHAGPADTEGIAELLRGAEGCRVSAVFTETEPGRIKVSLRSHGSLDVNAIARLFGGGGHVNAAGIPAIGDLDSVVCQVTRVIEEACRSAPGGAPPLRSTPPRP